MYLSMTPKLFITIGAAAGLIFGFILGDGTDWTRMIAFTVAGGVVGFAIFPVGSTHMRRPLKKEQDE